MDMRRIVVPGQRDSSLPFTVASHALEFVLNAGEINDADGYLWLPRTSPRG